MGKKEKKQTGQVAGERKGFAEILLAILIFPIKLFFKVLMFVAKMIIKSVILAPFTIIIWIAVAVVLVMVFL